MPRLSSVNGGVSLTVTLAASISALVFIAVASVLGLGLWSGSQNTMSLLNDKAAAIITSAVDRVRIHLDASQNQVEFVEQLIAQGRISPAEQSRFVASLTGALAAAPQISALSFIDVNHQSIINIRTPRGSRRFGCCQRVVKIVIPHPKWVFWFFLRKKLDSNIHSHEARRSKLFTR